MINTKAKEMKTTKSKKTDKKWYISKADDLDENDDDVVYVAMKDESNEYEATALVTYEQ